MIACVIYYWSRHSERKELIQAVLTAGVNILSDKYVTVLSMESTAADNQSHVTTFGSSQGVISLRKKMENKKELTFESVLGNEHFTKLSHVIFTTTLKGRHYYLHFTFEEIKFSQGPTTCQRSHT